MSVPSAVILSGEELVVGGAHQVVSLVNRRTDQQDAVAVGERLCALADGMGGHADGAVAAHTALAMLAAAVTGRATLDQLVAAVDDADVAVRALADSDYRNPGTTLVAVVADPDGRHVHGMWVGDSRIYRVDPDGTVTLITEDHCGPLGELVRCLGDHGPDVSSRCDTFTVEAVDGMRLLLCSDGVSGPLERDADDFEEALIGDHMRAGGSLETLVRRAAELGYDNATAVLVDVAALAR